MSDMDEAINTLDFSKVEMMMEEEEGRFMEAFTEALAVESHEVIHI